VRRSDVGRLVALAAMWGLSFIFVRVLAPALGVVPTVASRVLIGGLVLVAYCRLTGVDQGLARHWRQYFVIGVVNSTLPFLFYAFAALHIPASYSVILNATTPLLTALLAVPWLGERLGVAKIGGLLAGVAGVALVARAGPVSPGPLFAAAVAACLGATTCYAVSGIYMKKYARGAKPLAIAAWSQVFAGVVLLPALPYAWPTAPLTPAIVGNVLGLAVVCSSVAYVLYYRLIADVGPTRALTVAYLMPAFGMVWGALLLGETITLPMLAGCALIIAGTLAVLRPRVAARADALGGARERSCG